MEFSERFSNTEMNIASMEVSVADERLKRAVELARPFYLLHPRVFPDGNQWCVLLGENLQEGVAGFGDSPDLASREFDAAWYRKVDE